MSDMSKTALPKRARKEVVVYLRVSAEDKKRIVSAMKKASKFTVADWLRAVVADALHASERPLQGPPLPVYVPAPKRGRP